MIVFVIPLISRAAARDWPKVTRLCVETVKSCLAQVQTDIAVVLACTDVPEGLPASDRLHVVKLDYPVPGDRDAKFLDLYRKIQAAARFAIRFFPAHVMRVDADDLLSCHLAGIIEGGPADHEWVIDRGWLWAGGRRLIFRRSRFNTYCGSSKVIRFKQESDTSCDVVRWSDVIEADRRKPSWDLWNHQGFHRFAEGRGNFNRVPIRGAVYRVDHGVNFSDSANSPLLNPRRILWSLLNVSRLTTGLRDEFSLNVPR